jgi:hypothetical protein
VVGVLVDEQALMNSSAAIATPGRLNDRKEPLSPIDSCRGLTGLPPFSVALPNIHFVVEGCVEYFRVSIFTQVRGTSSHGTRQPFHQSVRNPPTGSRDPLNRWDRRRHARTFPSNPFNRVSTEFRQSFKNPPTRRTEGVIGGYTRAVTEKSCACQLSASSLLLGQSQQG